MLRYKEYCLNFALFRPQTPPPPASPFQMSLSADHVVLLAAVKKKTDKILKMCCTCASADAFTISSSMNALGACSRIRGILAERGQVGSRCVL